ncbi:MAG: T9SS type A sorting domain-containing protein [Opitutaceae bacterium]|nr:T9SS type A sorting domain-containing protein [Cytophagales bacterium]
MMNKLQILVPVFLLCQTLHAQIIENPVWENLTASQYVNDVVIQNDSVWSGTNGGLVFYDKVKGTIKHYNKANSDLPCNIVKALHLDNKKQLWVGTVRGGISSFDGKKWTAYPQAEIFNISSISSDSKNNIYVGSQFQKGLRKFDGSSWTSFQSEIDDFVTSINVDNDDNVYVQTFSNGIFILENNSITNLTPDFSKYINTYLTKESTGRVWASSSSDITYFGGNDIFYDFKQLYQNIIPFQETNKYDRLLAIKDSGYFIAKRENISFVKAPYQYKYVSSDYSARDSSLAIGTETHLILHQNNNWKKISLASNKLPSHYIISSCIDKNNTKWFGTNMGVAGLSDTGWTTVPDSMFGTYSNRIECAVTDKTGNPWFFTKQIVVTRKNNKWVTLIDPVYNFPENYSTPILKAAFDSKNNLYVAGSGGVIMYDGNTWTTLEGYLDKLPPQNRFEFSSIAINQQDTVFLGASNGVVKYFEGKWFSMPRYNFTLMTSMFVDKQNHLWMADLLEGLYKVTPDSVYKYSDSYFDAGFNSFNIKSMTQDLEGNIWMANAGRGLIVFNEDKYQNFTSENSDLADDYTLTLMTDKQGKIWAGGEAGISILTSSGTILSVSENNHVSDSRIYPNPTEKGSLLYFNGAKTSVKVYDLAGNLIKETMISNSEPTNNNLMPGLYILKYNHGNEQQTEKLFVR